MFTLNTNENLGMSIENVRLGEIRQEIDAQRLGDEVCGQRFGIKALVHLLSGFIPARNVVLPIGDTDQSAVVEI